MRLACLTLALLSSTALADKFYAEAGAGGVGFIGSTGSDAAPGPVLGVRGGWLPVRWLSIGLSVSGSNHEATVPPPPTSQYFQLYEIAAELRLSARLGRVSLFVEDTTGFAAISTNVLDDVGVTQPYRHSGPFLSPGAGLDYHLQDPHFSVGVAGDFTFFPEFASAMAVGGRLYLRYSK